MRAPFRSLRTLFRRQQPSFEGILRAALEDRGSEFKTVAVMERMAIKQPMDRNGMNPK